MTDKLRQAAEMALKTLEDVPIEYAFHGNFMDDEFGKQLDATIQALRQALDQLPDTTKMIDTGTDRGAWSDVPDATKWVDELRGDEPTTEHWLTKELFANYLELISRAVRCDEAKSDLWHKAYWMKKDGEV